MPERRPTFVVVLSDEHAASTSTARTGWSGSTAAVRRPRLLLEHHHRPPKRTTDWRRPSNSQVSERGPDRYHPDQVELPDT